MSKGQGYQAIMILWLIATFISSSTSGFSPMTAVCGIFVIVSAAQWVFGK